ncbi:Uncharacterized protein HZ326_2307 [Fusarium oxysporum f. sp. albedinis]|nr:Uncharacterized protein HZ326_2307 [Fusarium oxysporum f. sp. albedinis]
MRYWLLYAFTACDDRVAGSFLKQFDSPLLPGKISTGSLARVIDSMNRLKIHKQHRGIRSRSRPSAHVSRASESRTPYTNHGFVALNVGLQVSCFHCVAKTSYFRCPSPFPPMPRQTTGTKHRHHPHSYCSYPMRPWRNRIVSIYHRSTVIFGQSCSDDSRTISVNTGWRSLPLFPPHCRHHHPSGIPDAELGNIDQQICTRAECSKFKAIPKGSASPVPVQAIQITKFVSKGSADPASVVTKATPANDNTTLDISSLYTSVLLVASQTTRMVLMYCLTAYVKILTYILDNEESSCSCT